jgi:UDP-glucose 4-epimerase
MSRVCVIGGSGFLGSHVSDALTDEGHEVVVYDSKKSNWLKGNQSMIVGDILDDRLREAIEGCEVVYNFAALADLNKALNLPVETVNINILGNVKALEYSRQAEVKRFIYASSVYVFSREGGFYRCSKEASENYVEEYKEAFDLDYTILRFGSLYGPRSGEDNGIYRIIKTAIEENKISYEGNPESIREYIHVLDAANASVRAMGEEFKNENFLLTGHQSMKVQDLLKTLAEILDMSDKLDFKDEDYPGHYVRTPYAYQPKLGKKYIPSSHIDLGQGLLQLIEEISNTNK